MNLFTKRFGLVLAGVIGVGAIASMAVASSFALFSATTGPISAPTMTAGTLTMGTPATVSCTIGNLSPGDSDAGSSYAGTTGFDPKADQPACEVSVPFVTNIPAWVGFSVSVTSTAGTGTGETTALINPSGANPLQYELSAWDSGQNNNAGNDGNLDGQAASDPRIPSPPSASGTCSLGSCSFSEAIQTVLTDPATANDTINLYLGYGLPSAAGDQYMGSSATFTFTFYAVQAEGNTDSAGTGPASWTF